MDDGGMAHPQASSLAALAALLADETRATFCLALLDGRAWTASELARAAQVSRPTTTEHLNRLVAGGLLTEVRQGRHRYLRLADDRTAHLIEELTAHAPAALPPPRTLSQSSANRALARARTCYDHLAGRLGVTVTQAMTHRGLLRQDAGFALTDDGAAWLTQIGVDLASARSSRRPLVLSCVDFTERRPHLAGAVGAALHRHFLARGWVVPVGSGRALRVTDEGGAALRDHLGIAPGDLSWLQTPWRHPDTVDRA
jgi:DNA-binding transcriptional ArsR family regulator